MLDDEWVMTGDHQFVDCWCGHGEPNPLDGRTLNIRMERIHRWVTLACPADCELQIRVHGHVHVHCPLCAACC
jgi:hypothetical protein